MPSCSGNSAWRADPLAIEAIIARYGLAAVFLGAGIEGETAVVTGGVLAHQGLIPLWATMIAAVAGSFVADQLFFAGGRHFRDYAVVTRIREKPAFARAIELLERYPRGFIFIYRFIYGIRTASPIAIGTSKIRTHLFVAVNLLAAAIWGVLFSTIGYVFGNGLAEFAHRIGMKHVLLVAVILLVVGGIGYRLVHLYRQRKRQA